jgi:hypothetical protein
MSLSGWLFASLYNRMTAGVEAAGLGAHRERLLGSAMGHVLEIGAGTGANLPLYGEGVETLTFAEPEAPMARKLARRIRGQSRGSSLFKRRPRSCRSLKRGSTRLCRRSSSVPSATRRGRSAKFVAS